MPTRARKWEKAFLASLAKFANVSEACRAAGVGRTTVYVRRAESEAFHAEWNTAIETALDSIELAVITASLKGDMQTARWFLSRRRPQVYGDKVALEHSGAVQSEPVKLEVEWHGTGEGDDAD